MNDLPLTSLQVAVLARARALAAGGLLHGEILDVLDHEFAGRAWGELVWRAADLACLERYRAKIESVDPLEAADPL